MTAAPPDPYEVIRRLVIENTGGYLRNVPWTPPTCTYCAGVPSTSGYATCIACSGYLRHTGELTDRRGFITYALAEAQSGANMFRYKDHSPPQAATRMMTLLLAAALTKHVRCAATPALGPVTAWATVPSLSGRPAHPLASLAAPFLQALPWVALSPAAGAQRSRTLRPENFVALTSGLSPVGRHVLLLDDTWVTGSNLESAAALLKRTGARGVTSLVVARWLDRHRGDTTTFVNAHLVNDFDPSVCPFTGRLC